MKAADTKANGLQQRTPAVTAARLCVFPRLNIMPENWIYKNYFQIKSQAVFNLLQLLLLYHFGGLYTLVQCAWGIFKGCRTLVCVGTVRNRDFKLSLPKRISSGQAGSSQLNSSWGWYVGFQQAWGEKSSYPPWFYKPGIKIQPQGTCRCVWNVDDLGWGWGITWNLATLRSYSSISIILWRAEAESLIACY